MEALYNRRDELMAAIENAGPPTSMAGIIATARAALAAHYQRDSDGVALASSDSEWLLLMCAEALTGEG